MNRKLRCPICKKESAWEENPFRPFCSERCRMIDLGQWADEAYGIPTSEQEDFSGEGEHGDES